MKILFVHISFFTAPHSRHNQIMFMFSTNYRTIVNRLVIGSMTEILMEMGWCSQENWHSSVREGFQQTNKKRENNIQFQFSPEKVKEVTKGKNIFWKSPINGPEAKNKKNILPLEVGQLWRTMKLVITCVMCHPLKLSIIEHTQK